MNDSSNKRCYQPFGWLVLWLSYFSMVAVLFVASPCSPIAMLWGLAKLISGRAPSGHRQSWWADGVSVMF